MTFTIQTPDNRIITIEAETVREALIAAANATRTVKLPANAKPCHDDRMTTLAGFRHFRA